MWVVRVRIPCLPQKNILLFCTTILSFGETKYTMVQFDNAVERYSKIILEELYGAGIVTWIAGGALRDYFMGVPIKTDHDLFFPDEENYQKAVKFFKDKDAQNIWESDNGCKFLHEKRQFDLIKKFFPSPEATINEFDFTVSMFAVDGTQVYHGQTSFIDLAKRQLMINKITYPPSTLSRAFRYYKKGFSMCLGEMAKIVTAIQDMPKPEPQEEQADNDDATSFGHGGMFIGID